jgi:MraZ protein
VDEIFQGNALNTVDAKARLSVPAFIRSVLDRSSNGRSVYVGLHESKPCLTFYGPAYSSFLIGDLERRRDALEKRDADPNEIEELEAGLFGMGEPVGYDQGGRIVLPQMHRGLAEILDSVLFISRGRFVEGWNPKLCMELGGDNRRRIAGYYLDQGAKR